MPSRRTRKPQKVASGRVRLIGGDWRRRTLSFPTVDGVRPTPDRVRETLFNWLAPVIPGSRCLDLFAGSGALGLEALSRGAQEVLFVDASRALTRSLSRNLSELGSGHGQVRCEDVLSLLRGGPGTAHYDIVFMDPPFRGGWVEPVCAALEEYKWLREGSRVYVEHEAETVEPPVPANWELSRRKTAGQVCYSLFLVQAGRSA